MVFLSVVWESSIRTSTCKPKDECGALLDDDLWPENDFIREITEAFGIRGSPGFVWLGQRW